MELCREVGTSFEAIPQSRIIEETSEPSTTSIIDLTLKINQLQAENEKLTDELSRCKDKAYTESMGRHQAEQKTRQLEGELSTTHTEGGILQ